MASRALSAIAAALLGAALVAVMLSGNHRVPTDSTGDADPSSSTIQLDATKRRYCNFGEACWPDSSAWEQLSKKLGAGVLRTIADIDTVNASCYDAIKLNGGAGLAQKVANGTCILGGPCVYQYCEADKPPNLPVYSVAATELSHVQAAVDFARENNIRVSIKTSGAGYALGEQQPNSILIWMSNYQQYTTEGIIEDFTACDKHHGPALKVGGGEVWGQVFAALVEDNRFMMSSGAAVTVGGSGGWLQGGGLGPFDRSLGLGADNVLQFEVVTADGKLKTAKEVIWR